MKSRKVITIQQLSECNKLQAFFISSNMINARKKLENYLLLTSNTMLNDDKLLLK